MNKHSAQLQWFLVSNCGFTLPLHQTMISLGREHCDVILKSPSADGKHAVITYDHYEKRFKVKDLNTINGTYVNDTRIPVHTFVMLQHLDCLRFGFVIYQLQGISRIYSGPNLSHYNHSSTINNYYSPNISSSWTSPYISSPHLIINKMADCRNCECKQDVHKSKQQQYIGNVGQSSREAPELFSPDSSKHSLRQDYCGNLVSQQGIVAHNNAVCNSSDANKRNQCIDGLTSDPLKNGHCSLNSSPGECPQRTYSFNSLPSVNLRDESCAASDQCPEKIINSGTIVKSCHRRSASCDPIATEKSDFQTATRHQSLTECGSNSGKESIKEEEKINEMVVMKAEKPYVQSEAITERGTNSTDGTNDNGGGCRPLSTAFTIDFADNSQPTLSLKKLDIKDSISKFAPPKPECEMKAGHRRNLSLPKIGDYLSDENGNEDILLKKNTLVEKENGKDGVWDLSNTYGLGPSKLQLKESLGPVRGGYLSEGHMSSDQDDELSAKSDPTRKATDKEMFKTSCPVSTPRKIQELKAAKNVGRRSLPATGLRDSAKYLISRMFGEVTAPPSSPSDPPIISPVGPVSKLTLNIGTNGVGSNLKKGDVKNNSRSSLTSTKTYTVDGRELGKSPTQAKANLTEVQVEEFEGFEDEAEEEEDDDMKMEDENEQTYEDGSETGTYTIEKDDDNRDEVKEARKNIDIVFGLKSQNAVYEDETKSSPDICDEKKNKAQTPSKPNSSWLKEWAASSGDIKTTQLPLVTSSMTQQEDIKQASISTPWTHAMPNPAPPYTSSFSPSTTPEAPQRPRRRLPVIPTEKLNALPPSVHLNGMNSPKTGGGGGEMTKGYSFSNRSSPEGGNPSDSAGMDTETILKDTETVVSAMEARMDNQRLQQKNNKTGGRDSGGESDVDTSTASATNEVELRPKKLLLHKKVAAQLKSQLKSFEDDTCFEARSLSPRTLRRSLMGSVSSHGRTTPTDSVSEVETASVQSDISSSSELSGSSPVSKRKNRESAPLMRFNRAFSLRRARLGCEAESPPVPSPVATAVAKTPTLHQPPMSQSLANSRPSSANSATSSKGRAVHSNKSDSGSSSSAAVKKSASRPPPVAANNSFNRSDGGRFSLRLPRSAGPPPRPSSAKSPSSTTAPQPTPRVKSAGSSGRSSGTPRSNSTLSAKELELKNWKRRKEYDPLKAAAEGRKKEAVKKTSIIPLVTKSESPSPTSTSFHRSASFHGTDALNGGGGTHLRRNTFSLEDSEIELNSSDYHLDTPTQRHAMSDFEGEIPGVSLRSRGSRKSSEDELEATRTMSHTDLDVEPMTVSPRDSPHMQSHPSLRHKNKVDALDNLVISTIYQLSCHLRGNAEQLLGKLRDSQKGDVCIETKGLYEILERIALEDSPVSSPQGRSVSKQLSGILKNLKRIEESLQIVDQVVLPAKNCQLKKHEGSTSSLHSHKKWNGFKDQEYY